MKKNTFGFTLVELIVGIVILVFLSTIGYITFSNHVSGTRDATRFSKINEISNLLKAYKISHTLPAPLDFINIRGGGEIIGYQGYAGPDVLEKIHYLAKGQDPNDYNYFTYYVTSNRKSFKLMGFYEDEESLDFSFFTKKATAKIIDYSSRYPYIVGDRIGILTDINNTPIQEIESYISLGYVFLASTNKNDLFKLYITNKQVYSGSGELLFSKLDSISNRGKYGDSNNCPEGYISVWGDAKFNQRGFCVAKYEMTFSKNDSPIIPTTPNRNTYDFVDGKYYKSRIDYPIVNLTQQEAIDACKKLGKGYHLITNNEWMTIARQIEFENQNWMSTQPGMTDSLFTGNSNYLSNGCNDSTGPNSKITKTGDGISNCFYKRKNTLFNGEIIWDFSGNVAEHVNKANNKNGDGFSSGNTSLGTTSSCYTNWTSVGSGSTKEYGPMFGVGKNQGEGEICKPTGVSDNVFIRGGSYDDGINSGIYNLILDKNNSDSKKDYIGFRCAR